MHSCSDSTDLSDINERFYWTFTVGPAGGILRVMNIILSIPKDAVDKDVTIKIAISHNDQDRPPQESYCVVGPVIHCLPHGFQFRKPVALSFGCNSHLAAPKAAANLQVLHRYARCKTIKGQTKLTFTWHTPNRVNIK